MPASGAVVPNSTALVRHRQMADPTVGTQTSESSYDAGSIGVLKGLEGVRKRPGMYIGDTDDGSGLHHLVHEVVDNSVDEHLAGHCSRIDVIIHLDNSVTVEDNGRGIPVDIMATENRPAAEVVMTVLHAGGKFGGAGYKVSGGLHGVGVSAVNALSDWLKLEIRRNGKVYYQEYSRGVPTTEFRQTGTTQSGERHGTKTTFHPDPEIFKNVLEFSFDQLATKLKELAYLDSGLEITITDERTDRKSVFKFAAAPVPRRAAPPRVAPERDRARCASGAARRAADRRGPAGDRRPARGAEH